MNNVNTLSNTHRDKRLRLLVCAAIACSTVAGESAVAGASETDVAIDRHALAATVAAHADDRSALDVLSAWRGLPDERIEVMAAAVDQIGTPYRRRGTTPSVGFDCSGFVQWAHRSAGFEVPRSSRSQIRSSEQVSKEDAQPGDLVYYPGHIGMYLGDDLFIHAPHTGAKVRIDDLPNRVLTFGDVGVEEQADTIDDDSPSNWSVTPRPLNAPMV